MNHTINKRIYWIDILRGIAIIAVTIDHSLYIFFGPSYLDIQNYLFFSVPWFVFLSAITNVISATKTEYSISLYYLKRVKFIIYYVIASIFICLASGIQIQNLNVFLNKIIFFTASPPFYFFFILFQSIAIFPIIFYLIKKLDLDGAIVLLINSILISYIITVYGGSWKWSVPNNILCGPYLPVFMFGIIYWYFPKFQKTISIFSILCLSYYILFHPKLLLFNNYSPNPHKLIISICSLIIISSIVKRLTNNIWFIIIRILGQHSFIIFLLHYFILQNIKSMNLKNSFIGWVIGIILGLLVPILVEEFIRKSSILLFFRQNRHK
jgi:peptidoglycan/LPS O-acetylase OafA/YrhL